MKIINLVKNLGFILFLSFFLLYNDLIDFLYKINEYNIRFVNKILSQNEYLKNNFDNCIIIKIEKKLKKKNEIHHCNIRNDCTQLECFSSLNEKRKCICRNLTSNFS